MSHNANEQALVCERDHALVCEGEKLQATYERHIFRHSSTFRGTGNRKSRKAMKMAIRAACSFFNLS